jgi:hypothetical protein
MPSRPWSSARQFLDAVLEGHKVTAADLRRVRTFPEGDNLEFKSGKAANRPAEEQELRAVFRDYVAGFANGDGGVLIVGVTDTDRKVDGVVAPGPPHKADPATWARDILGPLAAHIHPPPRFQTIKHGKLKVLLIATPRAYNLVALPDRHTLRYPLRIHDQLIRDLPPYVVADILLGRRARPTFRFAGIGYSVEPHPKIPSLLRLNLSCRLENNSIVHAHRVVVGTVAYALHEVPPFSTPEFGSRLLQEIELQRPTGRGNEIPEDIFWVPAHAVCHERPTLRPFETVDLSLSHHDALAQNVLNLPAANHSAYYRIAIYVLADGAPPLWFQLDWEYVMNFAAAKSIEVSATTTSFPYAVTGRPVVAWHER